MAAPYIHLLRYVSVADKTTVNLRETPGGAINLRVLHGTPVRITPQKESGAYSFVTLWEPAKRDGYMMTKFLTTSIPAGSRDLSTQTFGSTTLKKGSQGQYVANLQGHLQDKIDATVKQDGIFGDATEKAVIAFQKKAGLTADGLVGKKTKEALAAEYAPNDFFTNKETD
ncbi:MAG: peptidoglycan-binding domain-containing protein [Clostridia bacterium]|nr:peptidoglycan-binding domain-containing protein [Clostridia bacterium]